MTGGSSIEGMTNHEHDVLVIGGGAAGLSGALTLARARRSVLVVDSGAPRNAPAAGVHGFLGHDGVPPRELVAAGRKEVESYGGTVVDDEVVSVTGERDTFVARLASGGTVTARRVLVTTGLVDELPDVPGLRERFGRDVLHCPYCHGWEVRDQPIGVLATGERSLHQVKLFRQWSDDVTLFLNDALEPSDDDWDDLRRRGIAVVDGAVSEVVVTDDRLTGVRTADGTVHPRAALAAMPRFVARSSAVASLGLAAVEHPAGVGTVVEADGTGQTSVPGVFVAGNVTDPMAQVVTAAAAGMQAGAVINADLLDLFG